MTNNEAQQLAVGDRIVWRGQVYRTVTRPGIRIVRKWSDGGFTITAKVSGRPYGCYSFVPVAEAERVAR